MKKKLLIIFVKNIISGNVKTRLAKSIGHIGASEIYKELVSITINVAATIDVDKEIYFSENIEDTNWNNMTKKIQYGVDLGERMKNAFSDGFVSGFESIVLVGSDLPDISKNIINMAFKALENAEIVFGPAQDGGYYLIGMNKQYNSLFENKPWSKSNLLKITLQYLIQNNINYHLLETLNDIDTYEDLLASNFYKNNKKIQQNILYLND